jgi:serine/threonine-protein kinase
MAIPPSEQARIPGYRLLERLAQNGSTLFLAWSERLDRQVVLKVWSPPFSGTARESFLVRLEHPNILAVLDVGEAEGCVYEALEYLEDETLAQRLRRGPLSEAEARRLLTVIATVLQFVREKGIVVEAPTSGVVWLGETPKLELTPASEHNMRPDYMAPEELSGTREVLPSAIDVYRAGALLYAMLTTRPPWPLDTIGVPGWHITPVRPVRKFNPGVSKALETICMKCLEREPLDRYGSLQELTEAVNSPARGFLDRLASRWARRRPPS